MALGNTVHYTNLSGLLPTVVFVQFRNAPQRADLMDAIKEACDRGIIIVTISQCAKGSVSLSYAAGQTLAAAGVVAGADMTPEVRDSHLIVCFITSY